MRSCGRRRSPRRCSALGIEPGDRVGTLAWNGYRHFELYYGVSGMGAVCHTINPRLFPEQIAYIVNHAEDQLLFVDLNLLPAGREAAAAVQDGAPRRGHDRPRPPAADLEIPNLSGLRGADRRQARQLRLAGVRRAHGVVALLHLGHDRQSQGRALLASLDGAAFLWRCPARYARPVGALSMLPVVPMFHVNAWGLPYAAPMVGAKLVFPGARSTARASTSCSRRRR